ncbi:MAG: methenyltetrahydromethanopterin cyclohydrolase [Candidatus Bathyarchaeia archaeon]
MSRVSVNQRAFKMVEKLIDNGDEYGVQVARTENGATIIDAGVSAKGGYKAGEAITEICLGGCGRVYVSNGQYGDLFIPSVFVSTDEPAIATLASQFAGWRIKVGDFSAMGSGPARALALEPRGLYDEVGYMDSSDRAVIVLETDQLPGAEVAAHIATKCHVSVDRVYAVVTPTSSLAGSVQIAGRVVETGLHKLHTLGLAPKAVLYGCGQAPVAPLHPKAARAMGRTNDVILYGGQTFYTVNHDDDEALGKIVERAPSSASPDYGRPFYDIFKAANFDFYKVDAGLFAPASLTVNNAKTGRVHRAGGINMDILRAMMGAE